jgi:hypothetical protein
MPTEKDDKEVEYGKWLVEAVPREGAKVSTFFCASCADACCAGTTSAARTNASPIDLRIDHHPFVSQAGM